MNRTQVAQARGLPPANDPNATHARLEETGGSLQIAGTDFVDVAPATFTLPASSCPGLR